jgi:hypothetical protein
MSRAAQLAATVKPRNAYERSSGVMGIVCMWRSEEIFDTGTERSVVDHHTSTKSLVLSRLLPLSIVRANLLSVPQEFTIETPPLHV